MWTHVICGYKARLGGRWRLWMRAYMLHHAFNGTGNGVGAAAGQSVAGVGWKVDDIASWHVQASSAGL